MVPDNTGFKAVIVARNATSSALFTNELTRNLGCAATGARALNLMRIVTSTEVDIVIISADLESKVGVGFDLASKISQAYPLLPIVILIDEPSIGATIRAFRSGARGVFNSNLPMSRFLDCVTHVRKGCIWAGPQETNFLLESLRGLQNCDHPKTPALSQSPIANSK
jgi:DNA-binding NarL/FixJ family response regulator